MVLITVVIISVIVFGLLLIPSISQIDSQSQPQTIAGPIPGEYIVTLKEPATTDQRQINDTVEQKAEQFNVTLQGENNGHVEQVYRYALQGFSVDDVKDPTVFLGDPAVKSVEPNRLVPLDTQYMPTGINRIDLDRAITSTYIPDKRETKLNVDIAIIDSVIHNHPDLNIFKKVNFYSVADQEVQYHGTHVAGTAAARDNLGGVVGVAQGARIWSLRVCADAGCAVAAQIAALDYATQNAASIEVINMSLGGRSPDTSAQITAKSNTVAAGITIAQSMGNTGTECQPGWGCAHPDVIAVSNMYDADGKCGGQGPSITTSKGTSRDDSLAVSSTWGSQADLMAPGTFILSTWPVGVPGGVSNTAFPYIGSSEHGSYDFLSGTSMATPHVAGAAALVKLSNPSFTPSQVKSNLQSNAYPQTQTCDNFGKGGLVQGANAKGSEKILYVKNY